MVRNLEINESKIIDLNERKKLAAQKKARAKKKFRTRVGIAIFSLAIPIGTASINSISEKGDTHQVVDNVDDTIYADIADLNELNLVLVNDGVNSDFFNSFSTDLESKGVSFEIIDDSTTIENMNGSETYISFIDYNSYGKTKVIGEYIDRNNQTDPLAIGINSSLIKNNLTDMGIQCGVKGYKDNGSPTLQAAPLENSVGDNGANRFITIAADPNTDVDKFSDAFVEGLLRFKEYITKSSNFDLITRVNGGETLEMIAQKHGISLDGIQFLNGIEDGRIFANETLKLSSYSDILTDKEMVISNSNMNTKSY